MSFQLSLPATLLPSEAPHSLDSLSMSARATLTVAVMSREERTASAQRAHCRLGGRDKPGTTGISVPAANSQPMTFTP